MERKPYLREVPGKAGSIDDPEQYPFSIPPIRELGILQFHTGVTFLI